MSVSLFDYGYLHKALSSVSTEGGYLCLTGSGENRHVEVVEGIFWNLVARVASWIGVASYNTQQITNHILEDVEKIEDKAKAIEVTNIFLQCVQKDKIKNGALPARDTTEKKIQKTLTLFQNELREGQRKDQRNEVIKRAASQREVLIREDVVYGEGVAKKVSDVGLDRTIKAMNIDQMVVDLDKLQSQKGFEREGSLSRGILDKLRATLHTFHERLSKNQSVSFSAIAPAYKEAAYLLEVHQDTIVKKQPSDIAKRAYELMQLRSLLRKAELIAIQIGIVDKLPFEAIWRSFGQFHTPQDRFLKNYVVTDEHFKKIKEQVVALVKDPQLAPHWKKELFQAKGVPILPLDELIHELEGSFPERAT